MSAIEVVCKILCARQGIHPKFNDISEEVRGILHMRLRQLLTRAYEMIGAEPNLMPLSYSSILAVLPNKNYLETNQWGYQDGNLAIPRDMMIQLLINTELCYSISEKGLMSLQYNLERHLSQILIGASLMSDHITPTIINKIVHLIEPKNNQSNFGSIDLNFKPLIARLFTLFKIRESQDRHQASRNLICQINLILNVVCHSVISRAKFIVNGLHSIGKRQITRESIVSAFDSFDSHINENIYVILQSYRRNNQVDELKEILSGYELSESAKSELIDLVDGLIHLLVERTLNHTTNDRAARRLKKIGNNFIVTSKHLWMAMNVDEWSYFLQNFGIDIVLEYDVELGINDTDQMIEIKEKRLSMEEEEKLEENYINLLTKRLKSTRNDGIRWIEPDTDGEDEKDENPAPDKIKNMSAAELADYTKTHGILVKRGDGKKGKPVKQDYIDAILKVGKKSPEKKPKEKSPEKKPKEKSPEKKPKEKSPEKKSPKSLSVRPDSMTVVQLKQYIKDNNIGLPARGSGSKGSLVKADYVRAVREHLH